MKLGEYRMVLDGGDLAQPPEVWCEKRQEYGLMEVF